LLRGPACRSSQSANQIRKKLQVEEENRACEHDYS